MNLFASVTTILMSAVVGQPAVSPGAGPKLAVVNLTAIFERYRMTRDLEQVFDEQRQTISGQAEKKRDHINLQRNAIQEIKPGTPDFAAREDALIESEVEFQAWLEIQQRRLKDRHKSWLQLIYNDIQAVIARIAEQRGIDLVLTYNDMEENAPDSVAYKQQILLRSVIFASDRVNLTETVIEKLDAEYDRRGGAASLHVARPPAPSANP